MLSAMPFELGMQKGMCQKPMPGGGRAGGGPFTATQREGVAGALCSPVLGQTLSELFHAHFPARRMFWKVTLMPTRGTAASGVVCGQWRLLLVL